jgi:hypothetical protein
MDRLAAFGVSPEKIQQAVNFGNVVNLAERAVIPECGRPGRSNVRCASDIKFSSGRLSRVAAPQDGRTPPKTESGQYRDFNRCVFIGSACR